MAVIKSKRQENPLQVLGMAKTLAIHTLTICNNEKVFPKRDRWQLTGEIVRTAMSIYIQIRHANAVRVEEKADYERRMELQSLALENINNLLGLIDIAGVKLNLPARKQAYWTGLCSSLEIKARSWHRSDKIRLKPGSIALDSDGLAVDMDALENILKKTGGLLAQQCACAASVSNGPGAV